MGYSLSVRAQSEALADRMVQFFEREYRPFYEVWGLDQDEQYSTVPDRDFSYRPDEDEDDPKLIGIDYNAAGYERLYVHTLVRWMALKIGQRQSAFESATFDTPVPFTYYDAERDPVLAQPLDVTPEKDRQYCVDAYGIRLKPPGDLLSEIDGDRYAQAHAQATKIGQDSHEATMEILAPELWKLVEPLRVEMKRLDERWLAGV